MIKIIVLYDIFIEQKKGNILVVFRYYVVFENEDFGKNLLLVVFIFYFMEKRRGRFI